MAEQQLLFLHLHHPKQSILSQSCSPTVGSSLRCTLRLNSSGWSTGTRRNDTCFWPTGTYKMLLFLRCFLWYELFVFSEFTSILPSTTYHASGFSIVSRYIHGTNQSPSKPQPTVPNKSGSNKMNKEDHEKSNERQQNTKGKILPTNNYCYFNYFIQYKHVYQQYRPEQPKCLHPWSHP